MITQDFTTTLLVDQTPEEVFNAINKVSRWWTGEPGIEGSTDKMGDEFTYRYNPFHYSKQQIKELIPGEKIVWLVTDSELSFVEEKDEWTGTTIVFQIARQGDKTAIKFTHVGLVPEVPCYESCSRGWEHYINGSLFKLLTGVVANQD